MASYRAPLSLSLSQNVQGRNIGTINLPLVGLIYVVRRLLVGTFIHNLSLGSC